MRFFFYLRNIRILIIYMEIYIYIMLEILFTMYTDFSIFIKMKIRYNSSFYMI